MGAHNQLTRVTRLVNYERAVVPPPKLTNYLLDPSTDKGKYFINTLGYSQDNPDAFENDLREGIANYDGIHWETNKYGDTSYEIVIPLGVTHKEWVLTSWIVRKNTNFPALVTAHVAREEERERHGRSKIV